MLLVSHCQRDGLGLPSAQLELGADRELADARHAVELYPTRPQHHGAVSTTRPAMAQVQARPQPPTK